MPWLPWFIRVDSDDIRIKKCWATYKRAMNLIFHDLLGVILEVYIDDIVVKSDAFESHLADLRLAFEMSGQQGQTYYKHFT